MIASPPLSTETKIIVRPYRPTDRPRIREIACRTAFRSRGHQALIDDAELFADYWTRYYTDYEPESAFVAERDGTVVGYALGCIDSRSFQRTMGRAIAPALVSRLLRRIATSGASQRQRILRIMRWMLTRAWREAPPVDLVRYPAHYHCNLLREAHGGLAYTSLALQFVERARGMGVPGIHGQVFDRRDGGVWQIMVRDFEAAHPEVRVSASSRDSTMGSALLGDDRPMVNRAFGTTLDGYATFLHWLRRWRRL